MVPVDVVVTGASSEYKKSILRFVKVHVNIDTSLYEAKHLHRTHALPTNYSPSVPLQVKTTALES